MKVDPFRVAALALTCSADLLANLTEEERSVVERSEELEKTLVDHTAQLLVIRALGTPEEYQKALAASLTLLRLVLKYT